MPNVIIINYLLSPKSRTYIFHRKTIYREEKIIVTKGGENEDELERWYILIKTRSTN